MTASWRKNHWEFIAKKKVVEGIDTCGNVVSLSFLNKLLDFIPKYSMPAGLANLGYGVLGPLTGSIAGTCWPARWGPATAEVFLRKAQRNLRH